MNLANGLAGLSLLSGSDVFAAFAAANADAPKIETKAQRKAHAAFTLPDTIAPWKSSAEPAPASQRASEIKAMRSLIDTPAAADRTLPTDVRTTFITYKALDRLQVLAEIAAKPTTSSVERAALNKTFAKGLADLKTYLVGAPSDKLDLSYARAARDVRTVAVAAPSSLTAATINGKGVRDKRDGALDGVTGSEKLRITLSQGFGVADTLTIDLATGTQPPTLDSVADAINAAIKAVPRRDKNGVEVTDAKGVAIPKWEVSAEPVKTGDKWGLSIKRAGFETVTIDQIGAADTVLVAGGMTGTDPVRPQATTTRLTRLDAPAGTPERTTLGTIGATDALATTRSQMAADADKTGKTKALTVAAAVSSDAMVTDAQGFSYVVGSTAGNTAGNLAHGTDDLLLTKVNSEGTVVWQRNLGAAGTAKGAAVTIAPDGGIVVAGSVTGGFDGAKSDGDIVVARYDAQGNESFSTLIRSIGVETASAIAVGANGAIYVGGRTDRNGGGGTITQIDAKGVPGETRIIPGTGSGGIRALAIDGDGKLLALTRAGAQATLRRIETAMTTTTTTDTKTNTTTTTIEWEAADLNTLDLGAADARAIAVDSDGTIAIVGATETALTGTQVNTKSGGQDGFVARIDSGLAGARVTYLGAGANDQADSVSFMGGNVYVGGRTTGTLGGARTGDTDAFVARVDAATGTIGRIDQFGAIGTKAEPVRVSAIKGGDTILGALGLHRGTLTPTDSVTLEAQTSLRTGDEFAIKVGTGAVRKVAIEENETLTTLADKVRKLVGSAATVSTVFKDKGRALSIAAKPGMEIELIGGGDGRNALPKLGLDAKRISAPATPVRNAPTVTPGGAFGLDLDDALQLDTKSSAAIALTRIKQAVSFTQSAYRSLYWDDTKALLAEPKKPGRTGGSTAIEQGQIANYQAALTRLSNGPSTSMGF